MPNVSEELVFANRFCRLLLKFLFHLGKSQNDLSPQMDTKTSAPCIRSVKFRTTADCPITCNYESINSSPG